MRNPSMRNIHLCEVNGLRFHDGTPENGIEIYLRLSKYRVFQVTFSSVASFKIRSVMGAGVRD